MFEVLNKTTTKKNNDYENNQSTKANIDNHKKEWSAIHNQSFKCYCKKQKDERKGNVRIRVTKTHPTPRPETKAGFSGANKKQLQNGLQQILQNDNKERTFCNDSRIIRNRRHNWRRRKND